MPFDFAYDLNSKNIASFLFLHQKSENVVESCICSLGNPLKYPEAIRVKKSAFRGIIANSIVLPGSVN